MMSLAALLFLCVVAVTTGEVIIDLKTGNSFGLVSEIYNIWWTKKPAEINSEKCSLDGVMKARFETNAENRRRMYLYLIFSTDITGWTFSVGDSETNHGYGGDNGTQLNNAVVHSIGRTIFIYAKSNPSGGGNELVYAQDNFFKGSVKIEVADQHFRARAGNNFIYIDSPKLFQLTNQPDAKGVNRDVYVGMNRVPDVRINRVGTGLCKMSMDWTDLG